MKNPAQAGFFVIEPDVVWMIATGTGSHRL